MFGITPGTMTLIRRFRCIKSYFQPNAMFSYYTVKETLNQKPIGKEIIVKGWVQAFRKHKTIYFVDLVDGTCFDRLQIVLPEGNQCPVFSTSIEVHGSLVKSSHKGQEVELHASKWSTLGQCPSGYPFEHRIKYSNEHVRQFLHLRPRTRRISSIMRIRNNAAMAVHQFFQNHDFVFVHTPVITRNDCEGAGEVFSVQLKDKSLVNDVNASEVVDEHIEDPKEFFGAPVYLTVSGQLHLEAMACAMSRVYNFGPAFRAESSRTRQHASEFNMIEAELAFADSVEELIQMVEKCIKHVAKSVFENCQPEVKFLIENSNNEEYLKMITDKQFVVMTYDEAIGILENNQGSLKIPIKWGADLATDHKTFLSTYTNGIPVFVTMFPSSLKPFYMKTDKNRSTAFCFDLLASYGGEICGGSLREIDEDVLKSNPVLQNPALSWYIDLRKYGNVPHGGFGIGFDRLVQSLLGISNIRDIIPFPRRKYDCKC